MMLKLLKYVVGIDMASSDFEVCMVKMDISCEIHKITGKSFPNTLSGFKLFFAWVQKNHLQKEINISFVVEATGVYHEQFSWFLFQKKQNLSVVLPSKTKFYLKSKGQRSKTDKLDARGLAAFGAEQKLEYWKPFSKDLYRLRALTRHLEALQGTKTQISNQLHALKHGMFEVKEVIKSLNQTLKYLEKQIAKIKEEIEQTVLDDEKMAKKAKLLCSIKGVGLLSVAIIIAETNAFTLFKSRKQLASYAGYDIIENQSGKKTGKGRISKQGNVHIRRAMHFPALNVVRYDVGGFKPLQERIYGRSGLKMKGYVAVQRKLLCLFYTLWKNNEEFDPKINQKKAAQSEDGAALDTQKSEMENCVL